MTKTEIILTQHLFFVYILNCRQVTQTLNNINHQNTDEYFQSFSADSLSDSSNFLHHTLRLGLPFVNSKDTESDAYNDVVHGKRDVRVPPGMLIIMP